MMTKATPPKDGLLGVNNRVRLRLREEADKRKLGYRTLAQFLNWGFNKVTQKMTGRTPMTLNEADALCFAVGLRLTEAARDRGLEFSAELTPQELWVIEQFRLLNEPSAASLIQILKSMTGRATVPERRGLTDKTSTPRAR